MAFTEADRISCPPHYELYSHTDSTFTCQWGCERVTKATPMQVARMEGKWPTFCPNGPHGFIYSWSFAGDNTFVCCDSCGEDFTDPELVKMEEKQ